MRSLFLLITAPLRLLVSRQFHPAALNCTSVDLPAEIATWSQYGNKTHSRISGFTQVNNTCSVSPAALHCVSKSLGFLDLPYDFLTSAVSGASVSTGEQTSPAATSGQYGHFDAFVSPPLPRVSNLTITNVPGSISVASTFSMPPEGLVVVSDVDDFLRELHMWNPGEFLTNAFGKFRTWKNINAAYRDWKIADPSIHFHYVTDAPETAWRPYVTYLSETFPQGTYDFRPLEFNSWAQTTSSRYENVKRLIETFPNRTYILAGDTATGSVVSAYSKLAKEFPQQVQCVLMRDVQLTEWSNWIIPNLNQLRKTGKYMLFAEPVDIRRRMTDMIEQQRLRAQAGKTANYTCSTMDTGSPSYPSALAGIISLWQFYIEYAKCTLQPFRPSPLCAFDQVEGKRVINPINRSWYRFKMAEDPLGREWYEEHKKKLANMRKQWKDNKRNEIKRDEL